MNCKLVEELLPLYAGRDLDVNRATLVIEHLQTCAGCARVAHEYRESVQLTEQFAPPVFSEAVYTGIRQRVLREIEAEANPPAWSQTIESLFRPRLTWAIASLLLMVVSLFAIYVIVNRGNDERQLAGKPPEKIQPGTNERPNSGSQSDKRADPQSSVNTGAKEQQPVGIAQHQRKRFRNTLANRMNTVGVTAPDAALVKTLRVEIQTKDPKIKIIWFVQQETKIPSSKGT